MLNLYAVWAANSYSIVYDANGGLNAPENQEDIAFDMEMSLRPDIPTRTGYTFLGWSTNNNSTVGEYAAGQKVKNLVSNAEGKVTLYAVWAANTYTIKYNANGGSGAPTEQNDIAYGMKVTLRTDAPTWHGRIFLGWSQNQNSTTASYTAGDTVSNLVADVGGVVTLYAVWEYAQFRIQYDANGGTNVPSTSSYLTYNSSFNGITSSTPSRTGYLFKGWSTASSGNVEFSSGQVLTSNEVNGLYNASSYSTLYAVWEKLYKISVATSGATVTGVTNGEYYKTGTAITLSISYSYTKNKTLKLKSDTYSDTYTDGRVVHTFIVGTSNISIEAGSTKDDGCFAKGTLITLGDGSQKKVEDLLDTDTVLSFNHETGKLEATNIAYIFYSGYQEYEVLTLKFSDNYSIDILFGHGFFDMDLLEYTVITSDNVNECIGHRYYITEYINSEYVSNSVELLSYTVSYRFTECYSILSAVNLNHFANGLLAVTDDIDGFFNIFSLDENMMYNQELLTADIEKYGLYEYADWSDYVTYEEFVAFNGPYLKVAVGKGLITEEQLLQLINRFLVRS